MTKIVTDRGNGCLEEISQDDLYRLIQERRASGSIFFEQEIIRLKESVFRIVSVDQEKVQMTLELQNVDPMFALVSSFVDDEIIRLASFNKLPPDANRTDKALSSLYDQIKHICAQVKLIKSGKLEVPEPSPGRTEVKKVSQLPRLGPGGLKAFRKVVDGKD